MDGLLMDGGYFPVRHNSRRRNRERENTPREGVEHCFSRLEVAGRKIPNRKTAGAIFLLLIYCPLFLNGQSDDQHRTGKFISPVRGNDVRILRLSLALRLGMSPK
jgi:hypothetical protein